LMDFSSCNNSFFILFLFIILQGSIFSKTLWQPPRQELTLNTYEERFRKKTFLRQNHHSPKNKTLKIGFLLFCATLVKTPAILYFCEKQCHAPEILS